MSLPMQANRSRVRSAWQALGLLCCLGAGTSAWAIYGDIKTVAPETPLPGSWVVLGYTGPCPPMGPFDECRWRVVMDTFGAPYGTRLQVHYLSPLPDGWKVLSRSRNPGPGDCLMEIENENQHPCERGDFDEPDAAPGSPAD
ncbi:MAG: hypothetical protein P4L36_11430 [Holophaga sp.]|nr:hypothetical protein [Holophaga sp.]